MIPPGDLPAVLHPVILPVPVDRQQLRGRAKVAALRALARHALAQSARWAGLNLGPLEKNASGAPVPSAGVFWSLSHKSAYVAAVAAPMPVGIDVERIKVVGEGMYQRIALPEEWALARPMGGHDLFFLFWTAKEAVLKAGGKGLADLSRCRIIQVATDGCLTLNYQRRDWRVKHRRVGPDHLVAITAGRGQIVWHEMDA